MLIKIKPNKKRIPKGLLIGLLACVLFYFAIQHREEGVPWYYYTLAYVVLFIYSVLFTLVSLYEYLRMLFYKKATLIISDRDLQDNRSIFSCGTIPRKDISDAEIIQIQNRNILVVKVIDTNKYLANRNFVKRLVLKLLVKKYQSPIIISEDAINYNLTELKNLIRKPAEE